MKANPIKFTEADIPGELRHLNYFAQRYGHPEYPDTVQGENASNEDLLRFFAAVRPEEEKIRAWHESAWPGRNLATGGGGFPLSVTSGR